MNHAESEAGSHPEPASGLLWLLRHGETEWSRQGRHTGRTDVLLTDRGREMAAALAPVLAPVRFALVLCSPLRRASQTAELAGLLDRDGCETMFDKDLSEWDYGDYEGLTTPQIREGSPGWTIWSGDPPGGETGTEVAARADRVLAKVAGALPRGDVIAVCHGHLGRALTARWLGLPASGGSMFFLAPASPCVLGAEREEPVVRRWNMPNPLDTGPR